MTCVILTLERSLAGSDRSAFRAMLRDALGAPDAGLHVREGHETNEVGGLPLREIALALWADLRMVRRMKTPCQNTDRLGEEFAGLQRCRFEARGLSRPSGRSIGAATYS
jgi:hypothetical protein